MLKINFLKNILKNNRYYNIKHYLNVFFYQRGCPGQLVRTSINPTGPEINDHVSPQWPSY
jgi:hypothetical protein